MDAPNAPNPADPDAQDQFVDMVQSPANQAQGPAVQNQAQGLAVQNQAQDPAVQNQDQGPAQVDQICLCSLHHYKSQHNPVQMVQ